MSTVVNYRGGFPFCIVPDDAVGPGTAWPFGLTLDDLAKTYWRRKTIRILGNIITNEPSAIVCVQKSASKAKCGYPEFGDSPSVPPKIYRTKTTHYYTSGLQDTYGETVSVDETTVESYTLDCYFGRTCSGGGSGHFPGVDPSPDVDASYTLASDCTASETDSDSDGDGRNTISGFVALALAGGFDNSLTQSLTVRTRVQTVRAPFSGSVTTVETLSDEFTTSALQGRVDYALGTGCAFAWGGFATSCLAYKHLDASELSATKTRLCFRFTTTQPCGLVTVNYKIVFTPEDGGATTEQAFSTFIDDSLSSPILEKNPSWSEANGTWSVGIVSATKVWAIDATAQTHEHDGKRVVDGHCGAYVDIPQPSAPVGYVCFVSDKYEDNCVCQEMSLLIFDGSEDDVLCKVSGGKYWPRFIFTAADAEVGTMISAEDHGVKGRFRGSASGSAAWDFDKEFTIFGAIEGSTLAVTLSGEWYP